MLFIYIKEEILFNQRSYCETIEVIAGADPGFPVGGSANPRWRGCQPPTQVLFSENVKTKEFGPAGGGGAGNFCM